MELLMMKDNEPLLEQFYDLLNYCFGLKKEMMKELVDDYFSQNETEIIGVADEEKLMANLIINDYEMYLNEKAYRMGGIGAVATFPEYRQNQCIRFLLTEALRMMNEKNQVYSLLAPFSYEFYGKYGWAIAEKNFQVKIRVNDIMPIKTEEYMSKKINEDYIEALREVHSHCYHKYNGAIKRSELDWKNEFAYHNRNEHYVYGIFNKENQLVGFVAYHLKDQCMHIVDWAYLNDDVKRYILYFSYIHRAQVEHVKIKVPFEDNVLDLLKNPRQEMTLNPGMMGRIVNLEKALKDYPYAHNLSAKIKINDTFAPWNNGTFTINVNNGMIEVNKVEETADITCSIQTISQIMFGYISFQKAFDQGLITVNNKASLTDLNKAMLPHRSFVTDYF